VDTLGVCIVPEKGVHEMGKPSAPYPAEFKQEAVRLARTSGKPTSQIARDLGVSFESLRHWIKQAEIASGQRQGLTTDEREELRRLRRENQVLQQEREILRNHPHAGTRAFLARESETG